MVPAESLDPRVISSLPKPWEIERTFNDQLFDWMSSAPWLAISAAAHGVILLVMLMIPWDLITPEQPLMIVCPIDPAPEELFQGTTSA
jgi:hypothetical protein